MNNISKVERTYELENKENEFVFYKSKDIDEIMYYANEISLLHKDKESFYAVLNALQMVLNVSEEHKKRDFPIYLLNIVLKDYGLRIV